jgi:hypothetical protein
MKITEYKTVAEQSPRELDEEVNRLIAKGYELYGSPYSGGVATDEFLIHQALVKIEGITGETSPGFSAQAG